MPYIPASPSRITDVEGVLRYVQQEFGIIARAFEDFDTLKLKPRHVAPERPRDGLLAMADGTNWNPGSGKGAYIYKAGTGWVFLG